LNEAFDKYKQNVAKYSSEPIDYSKIDWYIWPFKNGSSDIYTTNISQEEDINHCAMNSYFMKPFGNAQYLLASKNKTY